MEGLVDHCPPGTECACLDLFILWTNLVVYVHVEYPLPAPDALGPFA